MTDAKRSFANNAASTSITQRDTIMKILAKRLAAFPAIRLILIVGI